MAFTLMDAIQDTKDMYHLKFLAGKAGGKRSISWVHLVEDAPILNRLWGNELAVTTGLAMQKEEQLFAIIEKLIAHNSSGLIINIGQYIFEVPQRIIDYCEEHDFPLLTVPWEVDIAEMIKDYCFRIYADEQESELLAKAFINAMERPENVHDYKRTLSNSYDIDGSFQVAVIYLENMDETDIMFVKKANLRIRMILDKQNIAYSFFWYDFHFVLIVNNISEAKLKSIIDKVIARNKKDAKAQKMSVGIGPRVEKVTGIGESFKRAKAAFRMALYMEREKVDFDEMGIYKVFYTVEDPAIMREYCLETLGKLRKHDKAHNSNYEETLEQYIRCNGSLNMMSQAMYTHRNTINYRMMKIKELLDCSLETPEERFPYELAYYIKKMLRLDEQEQE